MPKPVFGGKGPTSLPWVPLPFMEDYLENQEADGNNPSHIQAVKVALSHFAIFAANHEPPIKHPDEIERSHILRFQVYVNGLTSARPQDGGRPLSTQYRQQIMRRVHAWINWLIKVEEDVISRDPWVRIKVGRTRKVSRAVPNEDMSVLFDTHSRQAFKISPFLYHRREVILVLLYGWGLRIHELAALSVNGMDVRQDFVTARNKSTESGVTQKILPYNEVMKETVSRWLVHRSKCADPTVDNLLITKEGRPLSTDMIYKIVTDLGDLAGITINPHRLRDTFGKTLLDEGVEAEHIMEMMGHTRKEQTLAYTGPSTRQMKRGHDAVMGPALKGLLHQ